MSTLIEHINSSTKGAPRSTVWTVHMACRMDIGSLLMDCRVNNEAGCIDGLVRTRDSISFLIYAHHVGDLEESKMYSVRVDPKSVWLDWIFWLLEFNHKSVC